MSSTRPIVYVVDDDVSVRESLEGLIQCEGWQAQTFPSAQAFFSHTFSCVPSCLLLDVSLPDVNGLDVQERVAADRCEMPIIFITGHADIPMTVRAMKAGAREFFTKPFGDDTLIEAIRSALARSEAALGRDKALRDLRRRYASLSRREREVMARVVCGLLNKQIGYELEISETTVKAHRGRVMRKMEAGSLAELVTMASQLNESREPATGSDSILH